MISRTLRACTRIYVISYEIVSCNAFQFLVVSLNEFVLIVRFEERRRKHRFYQIVLIASFFLDVQVSHHFTEIG